MSLGFTPAGRQVARVVARAAVMELVAAAVRQRERGVALADAGQHAARDRAAAGRPDGRPRPRAGCGPAPPACGRPGSRGAAARTARPDDQVGDAGLVLDGDEHDALGASPASGAPARGRRWSSQLPSLARIASAQVTMRRRREVRAQEGDRMLAQRQADMAVVLDHLAAGGHRPQRHGRLAGSPAPWRLRGPRRPRTAAAARRAAP